MRAERNKFLGWWRDDAGMDGWRRWLRAVKGRDALERGQARALRVLRQIPSAALVIAAIGNVARETRGGGPARPAANRI